MPKGYGFKSMFSVKSAGGIKKGKKNVPINYIGTSLIMEDLKF